MHKGPIEECSDEERIWYPQRLVCRKTMDLVAAEWRYAEKHKDLPYHSGNFDDWVAERSPSHPFHFMDGVRLWVSDVDYDPDGSWLSSREPEQGPEDDQRDQGA